MTSGNRVEQLETQVAELEATVEGLTEELVEAHERIRQIELALGGAEDVGEAALDDLLEEDDLLGDVGSRGDDRWAAAPDEEESEQTADATAEEADPDDVESAVEAAKGDEDDEGDEGGLDDIIVA